MAELKGAGEYYKAGDFSTGLEKVRSLWASIPEPKSDTANAYLVIEYGVAFAFRLGDLDEAQQWASEAPAFAEERLDSGEVEFLVGKVAFERGELDVAKENFLVARQKSKGRIFQGEDPKYQALLKNP